ncbi:MAG TPA: UDP-N-acetylmuramate dehydrogenase [Pyrinomonadaceae bacterium]
MSRPDHLEENVPLGPLTTLGVGGPARFLLNADSEDAIVQGFEFARSHDLPVFVLGGGSNILASDRGFDGLVIRVELRGISRNDDGTITAAAGEGWDELVADRVDQGFAGVECLSGIPGTVGGTPVQNVGAYGQEVSESIVSVRCFDRRDCQIVDLANNECGFSYRTSIFNTAERDRYVVVTVTFQLVPNGMPKIVYRDLIEHFAGREPTLAETREAVLAIRRSKSMVIDLDDPNHRSAGSFFKNPIVLRDQFEVIASRYGGEVPSFPAGEGAVKIPAAWLIEHAGFHKGYAMGAAGISTNHTLAIINRGDATAANILALATAIQTAVGNEFNIALTPEPVFVGDLY